MSRSVEEWVGKTDDTEAPPRVRLRPFGANLRSIAKTADTDAAESQQTDGIPSFNTEDKTAA